jgi:hypothetical protein
LFDLIRTRDAFPPKVKLDPGEIKEILMKMRGVNDIWLRTMGEDEGNVQCLAGWLRLFVGSNEPKKYEGIVAPAIWVGLAFPFFFLHITHTLDPEKSFRHLEHPPPRHCASRLVTT